MMVDAVDVVDGDAVSMGAKVGAVAKVGARVRVEYTMSNHDQCDHTGYRVDRTGYHTDHTDAHGYVFYYADMI